MPDKQAFSRRSPDCPAPGGEDCRRISAPPMVQHAGMRRIFLLFCAVMVRRGRLLSPKNPFFLLAFCLKRAYSKKPLVSAMLNLMQKSIKQTGVARKGWL